MHAFHVSWLKCLCTCKMSHEPLCAGELNVQAGQVATMCKAADIQSLSTVCRLLIIPANQQYVT